MACKVFGGMGRACPSEVQIKINNNRNEIKMNIKSRVASTFKRAGTAIKESGVYDAQIPLDDLCADFSDALDLTSVGEAASFRLISWGAAYQSVLVVPWQRPNDRHPEWKGQFAWHNRYPIPLVRSDGVPMEDVTMPTFRLPNRRVRYEIDYDDKVGIPRMPEWYSIVTGETPSGEKVGILANWTFIPPDEPTKTIVFNRVTALMKCTTDAQDWLNDYAKVSACISSTVEEFSDAEEEAREAKRQEFEGAKDLATEAALQF